MGNGDWNLLLRLVNHSQTLLTQGPPQAFSVTAFQPYNVGYVASGIDPVCLFRPDIFPVLSSREGGFVAGGVLEHHLVNIVDHNWRLN